MSKNVLLTETIFPNLEPEKRVFEGTRINLIVTDAGSAEEIIEGAGLGATRHEVAQALREEITSRAASGECRSVGREGPGELIEASYIWYRRETLEEELGHALTFGKHEGKSLEWLFENDREYANFVIKEMVKGRPKVATTLAVEEDRRREREEGYSTFWIDDEDALEPGPRENRSVPGGPGLSFEDLPDGCAILNENEALEGLEIYFPGSQPEEITGPLKEAGWIFHPEAAGGRGYWFNRSTEGEAMKAAEAALGQCEAEAITTTSEPAAESGMQQSAGIEVFDVPLEDVHTDPGRFQPRGGAFSEKTAARIAEDYDEELMDPIDLWRDPEDGKLYVLAGHSRLEGFRRRGDKDSIPAEIKDPTEEEAIRYALIENESGTDLTASERAGVLRDIVEAEGIGTISGRKEKAKDLFGKAGNEVFALSYLAPSGPAMQALRQFEGSSSADADDVLQMAKWTGKIRRFNRELSDLHERNVWDFLTDNFKTEGKQFTAFTEFRQFVEETLNRQFFGEEVGPETPLNLDRVDPKSQQEEKIDRLIREKREERNEARKKLRKEREDLVGRGASKEDLERALSDQRERVQALEQELVDLKERAKRERGRLKEQEQGLFGGRDNPEGESQLVYMGRSKALEIDTGEKVVEAKAADIKMYLFTNTGMSILVLVPPVLVEESSVEPTPEARETFETFHNYDSEEGPVGGLRFLVPDAEPTQAGLAHKILYTSDKVIREGDAPGEDHEYYHYFEDAHPAEIIGHEGGPKVLGVGTCMSPRANPSGECNAIEIDERGILN